MKTKFGVIYRRQNINNLKTRPPTLQLLLFKKIKKSKIKKKIHLNPRLPSTLGFGGGDSSFSMESHFFLSSFKFPASIRGGSSRSTGFGVTAMTASGFGIFNSFRLIGRVVNGAAAFGCSDVLGRTLSFLSPTNFYKTSDVPRLFFRSFL